MARLSKLNLNDAAKIIAGQTADQCTEWARGDGTQAALLSHAVLSRVLAEISELLRETQRAKRRK